MKPLSLKEARELEIIESKALLAAKNKAAARDLLLEMMLSLPPKVSSSERSFLDFKKDVKNAS